jgi:hypothetical protein
MRQIFRFDLKLALLLLVNCSILTWLAVNVYHDRPQHGWPQDELDQKQEHMPIERTMLCVSILSSAFSFVWLTRNKNRPILMGAIGGILGLVILFSVYSLVLGVHYVFYYEGGSEYVEDGAFFGLVLVPIIFTLFYSPLLAAVGALVGGIFWASQVMVRQRTRVRHEHSQRD